MATNLWIPVVIVVFYAGTSFLFRNKGLTVLNYKGSQVPYNFGTVILLWAGLDFLFAGTMGLTGSSFWYVFTVWALGWVDDRYGLSYPKGVKGHCMYLFRYRRVTTGLFKAAGGTLAGLIFAGILVREGQISILESVIIVPFLVLLPHVFNLLDTRPLRVLKTCAAVLIVPAILNKGLFYIPGIVILFLLWAREEGGERTMLGDNGAMTAGAIAAAACVNTGSLTLWTTVSAAAVCLTILSEKWSFSRVIAGSRVLSVIDQAGRRAEKN
ncbi:hypothetical protein [Alteribacter natronophilus]|uniref:hypothetical protein n=1 Tax=Alteribacter natronophilus TaxID=2583810 RepID=UPI00110E22D9|nr:hypothetical protein [Alteribacter natronophilus]TMW73735.1 hypothetical protein FGB90_05450 [Alteribacter natronophilus]